MCANKEPVICERLPSHSALTHQGNQVGHGFMHWAAKNARVQVFITALQLWNKQQY